MIRRFLPLVVLLLAALALGPRAAAQTPATGELFVRTEGDVARAVIRIRLQGRWHLYHSELGHPKAIGQPTTVTFEGGGSGGGVEWSPVRFPEPVKLDQSDVAGEGVFILAHEHELVLRAAGRLAAGASAAGVTAKVKGLVCEDVQGCIPYRATLEPAGPGPDALFADWPADLVAPVQAAQAPGAAPAEPAAHAGAPAAAAEPPEDELHEGEHADATLYTRVEGAEVRAALVIELDPEWHLYHTAEDLGWAPDGATPIGKPTIVTLSGEGIAWEPPRFPEPERLDQSEFNGAGAYINAHEGTVVVYARGKLAPGATATSIEAEIEGQVCDPMYCLDYHETAYDRGRGPDEVWSAWDERYAAAAAPTGDAAVPPGVLDPLPEEKSLLAFLLLAVGGAMFALVMPCTYPMIPITISFFTKQAERRGGSALSLSLVYGAGIVLIFILIGLVFGSLIIPFATHPVTNLVIGLAFLYFALALFGVVELNPPRFLMNAAGSASARGGLVGVFLMGATLVVTSFTCTVPFMGSLLSVGASDGNLGRLTLGMATFGATMAVPFVLLSLVPGRMKAMPRSGEWMNTVKVFMGFVEVAAALKFLSNADLVWDWQILSREVFLMAWGVIFVLAALHLFGVFSRGGPRPGGKRLVGATATLAFALYCFWGMVGNRMDFAMTAIAPPYSGGRAGLAWYTPGGGWPIVKDDYDAALAQAAREKKLLLVNFTGFT